MNQPKRIYIIGTSGSGKTTLAKRLSNKLGHPHIDLDPIRYPLDKNPLSHEESVLAAKKIADQETWIAEGIYLYWVKDLLEKADQIIWVDTPRNTTTFRIMKRYFINRLKGEKFHGFRETVKFAYGSRKQHDNKRTELGEKDGEISPIVIEKTLKPYKNKVIRLKNKADFKKYLEAF